MKKIILILFSLTCFLSGKTQTGVVRLEFEAAINSDIYELIPLGNNGFIVFYETREYAGEESKNWLFSFYSPSFQEAWKASIPVIENGVYEDYLRQDSMLYIFFMNAEKVRSGAANFQILTIDLKNGLSYETRGALPSSGSFVSFSLSPGRAQIALNLKNEQAGIYSVDLKSGIVNPFLLTYPDQNFIEDMVYDSANNQVLCVITNYLSKRQNKMYLITLAPDASFLSDQEILPVMSGKYLNSAKIILADTSDMYLLGIYGNIPAKIPVQSDYFGVESAGVFITKIRAGKQEFMNYYNFMEFRNLRAGVSARDFYRLQKKKDRESPEVSMNYELLLHKPELRDSTLVMMMEAFYPEFRTVSDISYDYWGRPVTHTYSVFDGFRFFNTIMTGFNSDGELAWDNSIEVNSTPTFSLEKKSSYFFDGKPALLFYNDGARISYRICLKNSELEPFSVLDLETSEFGDKITAIGANYVTHWYDYYFLAYGYHTIQNNLLTGKNERTVFYINKISLE